MGLGGVQLGILHWQRGADEFLVELKLSGGKLSIPRTSHNCVGILQSSMCWLRTTSHKFNHSTMPPLSVNSCGLHDHAGRDCECPAAVAQRSRTNVYLRVCDCTYFATLWIFLAHRIKLARCGPRAPGCYVEMGSESSAFHSPSLSFAPLHLAVVSFLWLLQHRLL